MKLYVTVEQWKELSPSQTQSALALWNKRVGDHLFCEIELTVRLEAKKYNGVYYGVVTDVHENSYHSSWDMKGSTGVFKYIIGANQYPLFSYGQLVEIIIFHKNDYDLNGKTIDDLWETFKEMIKDSL